MPETLATALTPESCEFCDAEVHQSPNRRWQRSPNGRPYCPECGRIPSDHQRDEEVPRDV